MYTHESRSITEYRWFYKSYTIGISGHPPMSWSRCARLTLYWEQESRGWYGGSSLVCLFRNSISTNVLWNIFFSANTLVFSPICCSLCLDNFSVLCYSCRNLSTPEDPTSMCSSELTFSFSTWNKLFQPSYLKCCTVINKNVLSLPWHWPSL